ncbi:MAG: hypothetical protein AAGA38_13905, partial [Pseudomonadota bacterium]
CKNAHHSAVSGVVVRQSGEISKVSSNIRGLALSRFSRGRDVTGACIHTHTNLAPFTSFVSPKKTKKNSKHEKKGQEKAEAQ